MGAPPEHLVSLRRDIVIYRQAFDTGFGGNVKKLQRLREEYITGHQLHLDRLQIERHRQERINSLLEGMRHNVLMGKVEEMIYKQADCRFSHFTQAYEPLLT